MKKLIFDIETIGENFDLMDKTTKELITRWIRKESDNDNQYRVALDDLKEGLGFSPLTGQIVAIGTLDAETNSGAVYFQSPGQDINEFKEDGIVYRSMKEAEMIKRFWDIAAHYQEFVTFNGRSFDVPFIMVRSAVNGLRPSKDLMSNRYTNSQKFGSKHIDLLDQLSFYGAVRKKGSLHLWTRVFSIKSPKSGGVSGDMVGPLYREGKFLEIARYNAGDLRATLELYKKWDNFLNL